MGNGIGKQKPKNKTGRKIVAQKLENAKKTGILSLSEHGLETLFPQVFELTNITTLDLSKNSLTKIGNVGRFPSLKFLNVDDNKLPAGSLDSVRTLTKLQTLSASGNALGRMSNTNAAGGGMQKEPLPQLPPSLKQLKIGSNYLSSIPPALFVSSLPKLQKLDLSNNRLGSVPAGIGKLTALVELNLDGNVVVSLPEEVGQLTKLKQLSLKNNKMVAFVDGKQQSIPDSVFTDTPLIDLNLHGNPMTSTQLNHMKGYDTFLERREKVKTSGLYGGAMTNLDVCGLE